MVRWYSNGSLTALQRLSSSALHHRSFASKIPAEEAEADADDPGGPAGDGEGGGRGGGGGGAPKSHSFLKHKQRRRSHRELYLAGGMASEVDQVLEHY